MTKRMKQVLLGVVALAPLGLGGSALAQGGTTPNRTLEPNSAPDRDQVQSGDQTTPDLPAKSSETARSEAPNNDGPGGHADEPGKPNADHQFDGQE